MDARNALALKHQLRTWQIAAYPSLDESTVESLKPLAHQIAAALDELAEKSPEPLLAPERVIIQVQNAEADEHPLRPWRATRTINGIHDGDAFGASPEEAMENLLMEFGRGSTAPIFASRRADAILDVTTLAVGAVVTDVETGERYTVVEDVYRDETPFADKVGERFSLNGVTVKTVHLHNPIIDDFREVWNTNKDSTARLIAQDWLDTEFASYEPTRPEPITSDMVKHAAAVIRRFLRFDRWEEMDPESEQYLELVAASAALWAAGKPAADSPVLRAQVAVILVAHGDTHTAEQVQQDILAKADNLTA
ncbi:hypothetical protein [Agromyces humi]|uniref:hypothetical protein n=1 Tax=Agromyces humi TaxID=1766800 RepID=UPI0013573E45|nr:hypothetical protein [Agromyces humi]